MEVDVRVATTSDAGPLAELYLRALKAASAYIPTVHSDDEVRWFITEPNGLQLRTFESNVGAQRFYERHGFTARDRTDGDNKQGAPDILYVWDGA